MFAASNATTPNSFTTSDLEAIRNLGVSTTTTFNAWLLSTAGQAATGRLLEAIPATVDLQDVSITNFPILLGSNGASPVSQLWNLLVTELRTNGQGSRQGISVVASKLIAGKRPRLVPITDSYVRSEIGISGWTQAWSCYHTILTDSRIRRLVAKLREDVAAALNASAGPLPSGVNPIGLSDARILDLAAWCFHERRVR
jgi:hypothetical protein